MSQPPPVSALSFEVRRTMSRSSVYSRGKSSITPPRRQRVLSRSWMSGSANSNVTIASSPWMIATLSSW